MASPTTPLSGNPIVSAASAIAYAEQVLHAKGDYRAFISALWKWAPENNINPLVAFGHWIDETNGGKDFKWTDYGDPGGIGSFTRETLPDFGGKALTGKQSAAVYIAELASKMQKRLVLRVGGIDVAPIDPHLKRVKTFIERADWPDVRTIDDLRRKLRLSNDYVWMQNQHAPTQIAAHINSVIAFAEHQSPSSGGSESEAPVVELSYGNVKHPPFRDEVIPDDENGAWDYLGPRKPCGLCQHSMVGHLLSTSGWFRRGRGVSNGLTDYGIGNNTDGPQWDGVIVRWNDPLGAARASVNYTDVQGVKRTGRVSAHRSGWANGGSDGLEGDGPLYVRTKGISGINRDLVSIERSDNGTFAPMSPKQFDAICALSAYWFDYAKVGFDTFPFNNAFQMVTYLLHLEFATKGCPHQPVVSRVDEIQDRIRAILKAGQTLTDVGEPLPPVTPPNPDHDNWAPFNHDVLVARYGTFAMTQHDGSEQTSNWDDNGSIPNAWVARAKAEKITREKDIPPPLRGHMVKDSVGNLQTIVLFDGPARDAWILFRPAREVAWAWVR